ncbi:MAG: hypothetical protein WAS27_00175 [Candidatus Saccharimonadales bacterium]
MLIKAPSFVERVNATIDSYLHAGANIAAKLYDMNRQPPLAQSDEQAEMLTERLEAMAHKVLVDYLNQIADDIMQYGIDYHNRQIASLQRDEHKRLTDKQTTLTNKADVVMLLDQTESFL